MTLGEVRSPRNTRAAIATSSGLDVTTMTELATDVCPRDVIQKPKCRARHIAEAAAANHWRSVRARSWRWAVTMPRGTTMREARPSLYAATVSAGAAARRMSAAALETETAPRDRPL